jgi:TetR/AcrR family transcriptional regulator, ethionamide resistance regulator
MPDRPGVTASAPARASAAPPTSAPALASAAPLPRPAERRPRPAGEHRREAILRATEELVRERPLNRISVGEIAGRAGVGRSGFYFYFASKGAVVAALLSDVFDEMRAGATLLLDGGDPATALDGALREALWQTWRSWHEHEALILAMLDARAGDPALRELWDAWVCRFVGPLAGVARRLGHPDGAEPLLAVLLAANERTFERLSRAGGDPADVARTLDALVCVWQRAIPAPTPEEQP